MKHDHWLDIKNSQQHLQACFGPETLATITAAHFVFKADSNLTLVNSRDQFWISVAMFWMPTKSVGMFSSGRHLGTVHSQPPRQMQPPSTLFNLVEKVTRAADINPCITIIPYSLLFESEVQKYDLRPENEIWDAILRNIWRYHYSVSFIYHS